MSKTLCIVVTDNPQHVEEAKGYWQDHDVTFQSFTSSQWKEGLVQPQFRDQISLGNPPSLHAGLRPLPSDVNAEGGDGNPNNVLAFRTPDSRVQKMDELEAKAIENAILQYKGNLTEAAKALGIGRATLYRKVKQYQIDPSMARRRKAA